MGLISKIGVHEIKDAKARNDIKSINENLASVEVENKKLTDEITLTNNRLTNEVNYINNKVQNGLQSISTGTPIPVSSIEEMNDTNRIYVNTSNGHWYYYNSSEWVDGGVYQASEDSESLTNLNNELNKYINALDNLSTVELKTYFDNFTKGRITTNYNSQYAYSSFIKNKGNTKLYFDETKYKLLIYNCNSLGEYVSGTGWKTTSPVDISDDYEYFGCELMKLDESLSVQDEDLINMKKSIYVINNVLLGIINEVNSNKEKINILNNNYISLFHKMAGVGDSLMSGSHCTGDVSKDRYPFSWLSNLSNYANSECVHYSKGGLTCKTWLNSVYKTQLETDEASSVYFIGLGTNDKNQTEYPIGSIGDSDTTESFVGYYKQIIKIIHEKNPNAVIFCMSMYDKKTASLEYSTMVQNIANLYDYCYFIDFINNTEHVSKDIDLYANDSHFTTIGYLYVSSVVNKLVNEIIKNNLEAFKWFGLNNE